MTSEQVPQMPSRQSCANAIGSSPFPVSPSFTTSSISRKDMSRLRSCAWYSTNLPGWPGPAWRQTRKVTEMFFLEFPATMRTKGGLVFFVPDWLEQGVETDFAVVGRRVAFDWCHEFADRIEDSLELRVVFFLKGSKLAREAD